MNIIHLQISPDCFMLRLFRFGFSVERFDYQGHWLEDGWVHKELWGGWHFFIGPLPFHR